MSYQTIDGIKMKKILLFIGIVLLLSIQVFSVDYNCDGDITLENYENINNININNNCYAIRFTYENNNTNVLFNLINNGNNGESPFLIYDNSEESDYENKTNKPFEFKFLNFQNVYFKYGSDYQLITSDYINRNKFIGNSNLNARIEIENSVESGQKYFISGSFSDFNDIDLYFENFGTNNEMGEYRVFLNNINNVNVYVDNNDYNSNEKILLIENDVNNILLNNNINDENNDYRIMIISFEDFMSNGLDKIYMGNIKEEIYEKEQTINEGGDDLQNNELPFYSFENIGKVYEENKYPFAMYVFGLILVFFSTFVARRNEKMVIKTKQHMALHLVFALIPSLLVLKFTSNGFLALVLSIAFSSIYSIIYYRNEISKKTFIRFVVQTIVLMILIGISYTIYNLII